MTADKSLSDKEQAWDCLLKPGIQGKIEGRTEVMGRRRRGYGPVIRHNTE
jgi:hypothetical protein